MALTYLQLVNLLADELDYNTTGTISTLQGTVTPQVRRMKNHINRAYNYVWLLLNHTNEEAETVTTLNTVADTESYNIPAALNSIDEIRYGTEPPVRILPWPEYERYKTDVLLVTYNGAPSVASIYQRKIWFFPTPDQAYAMTVRGKAVVTELSADADEPAFRDDFHRVIFEWALYFQMLYENNPATQAQQQVAQQAFEMARNASRNHFEEPPRRISEEELRKLDTQRIIYR